MSFAILDGKALTSSITDQGLIAWAVWTAILADKDQDGITTLNPRYLVKVFCCPELLPLVEDAWKALTEPDPHSKNAEHEGRRLIPVDDGRWLVVSHEKYKQIYRKEVRRDYLTQAKRAQRDREKLEKENLTSPEEAKAAFTPPADPEPVVVITDGDADMEPDYDEVQSIVEDLDMADAGPKLPEVDF